MEDEMIFGRMSTEKNEHVLIGLSEENLREMMAGKAVSVGPVLGDAALAEMQIILICGETEKDMVVALKKVGLLSPETNETP